VECSRRRLLGLTAGAVASGLVAPAQAEEKARMRAAVLPGIDALEADAFAALKGLRIGLLTHKAGLTRNGRRSIDVLAAAPDVTLATLFSPEHGLGADREGEIGSARDGKTKLPIVSLYGASKRPTPEILKGLDAVVIDLQDVGVRFYTYATTMAYLMEEAARARVKIIVLDRPNPIDGAGVVGPMLDKDLKSFVGYFEMPVQHGMTLGELARLFNGENGIGADLSVVAMQGYARGLWFDETGLTWTSPSPNLRRFTGTMLYPGIGCLEFANISVGRGTPTPFELLGAPWIDGPGLARALAGRRIPGVKIAAAEFTPSGSKFAGERCFGVRLTVADRAGLDAVRLGVEIAVALRVRHGDAFEHKALAQLLGSRAALAQIEAGTAATEIVAAWAPRLSSFKDLRQKYLLY
jgi:uncharacterized protein YbbC (DUF1343 family)